mmetsp:Transcript_8744/g.11941  ORF Transcript_8744/g.11941 Transcript_8744/m.11941 type:complete len:114 (-) Transcript_8744:28-369(-)
MCIFYVSGKVLYVYPIDRSSSQSDLIRRQSVNIFKSSINHRIFYLIAQVISTAIFIYFYRKKLFENVFSFSHQFIIFVRYHSYSIVSICVYVVEVLCIYRIVERVVENIFCLI